ncbi:hypothetical protein [Plantactinospora veratri]
MEVRRLRHVEADPTGGAELGQRGTNPAGADSGPLGEGVDVDRRVPGEQRADQLGVVHDIVAGQRGEARPSPEKPRYGSGERVSDSRNSPVSSSQLLGSGGAPAAAVGPYTRRVFAWRSRPRSVASRSAPARQTAPGTGRPVSRNDRPAGTAQSTDRSPAPGSRRRKAAASAAGISARGSKAAASTCTSAKPRSQRPGSGTFRSTTDPSIVETVRSSGPTERCSGSSPPTRASAARSGGLTSTLVVPCARISPSIPAGRASNRA